MNLIRGKYPVNTAEQVKTAEDYFSQHITAFSPAERMLIAARLDKQASELGVLVDSEWVKTYARPLKKEAACSPDTKSNVTKKKGDAKRLGKEVVKIAGIDRKYSDMIDKIANDKSGMFSKVQALIELDKVAGLDLTYDRAGGTMDPVRVFSGSYFNPEYDAVKVAGDLTDYDLRRMAAGPLEKVAGIMGDEFSENFAKDPCQAVYSLGVGDKEMFLNLVR